MVKVVCSFGHLSAHRMYCVCYVLVMKPLAQVVEPNRATSMCNIVKQ